MSPESSQCQAITKGGDQCRNRAAEGSNFCAIHQKAGARAAGADKPAKAAKSSAKSAAAPKAAQAAKPTQASAAAQREQVEAVADELNKLAEEVRAKDPKYTPPPFSPEALRKVLKANLDTLAAYMPIDLARDIIHNLEGTKPSDLLDPETWKGLWYILHYTATEQAKGLSAEAYKRIAALPGLELVTQFGQSVYESPGDLLDVETWKGAAVVLNAAVTANLSAIKRRLMGAGEE